MAGQYTNTIKLSISITTLLLLNLFIQGCACSFGWGHTTLSQKYYFPLRNWSDSTKYINNMRKFITEHPEAKLTTQDALEYLNNQDTTTLFEETDCPICLDNKPCVCVHYWYLFVREKNIVFKVGLYEDGIALKQVYLKNNSVVKHISKYELCELKKSERKKLYKELINCFENSLIPSIKPYFN